MQREFYELQLAFDTLIDSKWCVQYLYIEKKSLDGLLSDKKKLRLGLHSRKVAFAQGLEYQKAFATQLQLGT